MDLGIVLAFIGAAAVISLVPGPDMMFILANGISSGPRGGVVAAVGMSTGVLVHTVAAALGLTAVFQAVPAALEVVRIAGIAFLLYLAVQSLRSSVLPDVRAAPSRSMGRIYALAVLTNVSNPKVILFYLAFVPQFVSTDAAWPVPVQLLALGGVLLAVGICVDAAVGLASGGLSNLLVRRPGIQRWLDRAAGVLFGGLALRLATEDLR
ncbi:Threonine/homoserine/homoserine lactone efflux protein [Saccharopolyspora antimicrobica]|uniref:Threonine/homoserine/homoserine lactone efflux protein n=1 Tax=Saccharopolyspora antimicrobica TaxID=455193 RepID=A0A1I4YHN2_9PSEU|nr:LysE family translocator [Saccharopolyspora antimicrobica]RKT82665.1 threonine/homoserine/homoserine lactone efflux protein [Saccharopolyspora antimicrobica]SFN37089.1 Threonine/homoserine/homoserine lactone efflux protein [Saccharopolyspora antimicrobica]